MLQLMYRERKHTLTNRTFIQEAFVLGNAEPGPGNTSHQRLVRLLVIESEQKENRNGKRALQEVWS